MVPILLKQEFHWLRTLAASAPFCPYVLPPNERSNDETFHWSWPESLGKRCTNSKLCFILRKSHLYLFALNYNWNHFIFITFSHILTSFRICRSIACKPDLSKYPDKFKTRLLIFLSIIVKFYENIYCVNFKWQAFKFRRLQRHNLRYEAYLNVVSAISHNIEAVNNYSVTMMSVFSSKFLPLDAILAPYMLSSCVCLSVRPSFCLFVRPPQVPVGVLP